jgi:hypothetical protein
MPCRPGCSRGTSLPRRKEDSMSQQFVSDRRSNWPKTVGWICGRSAIRTTAAIWRSSCPGRCSFTRVASPSRGRRWRLLPAPTCSAIRFTSMTSMPGQRLRRSAGFAADGLQRRALAGRAERFGKGDGQPRLLRCPVSAAGARDGYDPLADQGHRPQGARRRQAGHRHHPHAGHQPERRWCCSTSARSWSPGRATVRRPRPCQRRRTG